MAARDPYRRARRGQLGNRVQSKADGPMAGTARSARFLPMPSSALFGYTGGGSQPETQKIQKSEIRAVRNIIHLVELMAAGREPDLRHAPPTSSRLH
jgi:hypothetical protein